MPQAKKLSTELPFVKVDQFVSHAGFQLSPQLQGFFLCKVLFLELIIDHLQNPQVLPGSLVCGFQNQLAICSKGIGLVASTNVGSFEIVLLLKSSGPFGRGLLLLQTADTNTPTSCTELPFVKAARVRCGCHRQKSSAQNYLLSR